jgi:ribosomal protein S18 acetylase RimI-like enzyme
MTGLERDAVLRAYEALWGEKDPAQRAQLIARCLADDAEIVGPGYHLRGHGAIADNAAQFQRDHPGKKALFASGLDAHSGWARCAIQLVAADGAIAAQGLDVFEFAESGLIRRVITFWGALPTRVPMAQSPETADKAMVLETYDDVPPDLARVVDDGLGAANERAAPTIKSVRRLACFARAPDGTVVGGAVGRTWGECCNLQQLWVDAGQRHAGLGTRVVRHFEEQAKARGCRTFYLDTFTFQAPAFYRKLGYEPALTIEGYGPGIECYTMLKRI